MVLAVGVPIERESGPAGMTRHDRARQAGIATSIEPFVIRTG